MTTPDDPNRPDPRREPGDRRPEREEAEPEQSSGVFEETTAPSEPAAPYSGEPPAEPSRAPGSEPPAVSGRTTWPPPISGPAGTPDRPAGPEPSEPEEPAVPGETPPWPPISTPSEPSLPEHPDVPTAPEIPEPVRGEPHPDARADTESTAVFESPAAPSGPQDTYTVPGATPAAYPGWESAPEASAVSGEGDRDISPGATPPSRYEPSTPSEGPQAGSQESPQAGSQTGAPPGGPYGEPAGGAHHGPSADDASRASPYSGAHMSTGQPGEPGEPGQRPPSTPSGGPSYPETPGGSAYPSGGPPYQAPFPPGGPSYPGAPPYPAPSGDQWSRREEGGGLGTAALVLGIVSIFLLFACGLGVLTAIVGLILGIVAVAKNSNRGRAWVGIVLSALTLIIAVVFVAWLYNKVGDCVNLPPELQQRCIEEKFGVQVTP
ncbi:hypothetical protein [Streptosporangium sp. NPDC000396]|uniref:DUF4190 domain-containing protein n=1 Tax=Streptosporangium sp. NPDC000396 TaxID=3366185 RepID=UPI003692D490